MTTAFEDDVALRFFALDRDVDVSGVSSSGRVAYAIQLPAGVLLVWDTFATTGIPATGDWRPNMRAVDLIHGHGGKTRITPLDNDCPAQQRAVELFRLVAGPMVTTCGQALDLLSRVVDR